MKRFILLFFALILCEIGMSQIQIKEGSFKKINNYVMLDKYEHTDINNNAMALIKITAEGMKAEERARLIFKGNMATYFDVEQKGAETYLYLTAKNATFVEILHPDYGKTEKYWFPEQLCDFCGYEMVVQLTYPGPHVNKPKNNAVTITADQENSYIYIDDNLVGEKEISKFLPVGSTHTYKIECELYHTETGSFTVTEGGNGVVIEKQLRPAYGFMNVTSQPESGAVVFINNKKVGVTPYKSGKMASGTYDVKVVKEMFGTKEQKFTVNDGQTTEAVLNMNAHFVDVTITTDALSEIYVDEVYVDKGSWMGRLTEGTHVIEARKDKHYSSYKEVNVVLGKNLTITVDAPNPMCGFLEISSSPLRADVYIDGQHYGQTPKVISNLLVGEHQLKLSKEGCAEIRKTITIVENETLSLMEKMQTGKEITINTGQKDDKIYVDGKYVGTSPYKTNLSYGSHNIKAERGSQTVTKNIEVTQNSELVYAITFEKEPLKKYLDRGVNFLTLNVAHSVAPQTSFGFTYGQVKKFGWFVSAMTNFGFRLSAMDMSDVENAVVNTGNSSKARLSLIGGAIVKIGGPVYMKLGA